MKSQYSDQLKQEIIEQFKAGKSVSVLKKQYKISDSTIYRWVKGQRRSLIINGQVLYSEDVLRIIRENERYRKENELFHKSLLGAQARLEEKLPEMIRLKEETGCDVHTLCRAFGVLRSTFYHRTLRSPEKTQLQTEDALLSETIKVYLHAFLYNSKVSPVLKGEILFSSSFSAIRLRRVLLPEPLPP